MRAVVDTNVLVSGVLNPHGSPGRIVNELVAASFTLLYDDRILSEYREVLSRPVFGFRPADIDVLLDYIEAAGEYVHAEATEIHLPDSSDLPFLEVAISGAADVLVTGNIGHLKPRRGRIPVRVVTPAEFVALAR